MKKLILTKHIILAISIILAGFSVSAQSTVAVSNIDPRGGFVNTYEMGIEFTVNTDMSVTSLGAYDYNQDGFNNPVPVTIWNGTGGVVATGTVPSGTVAPLDYLFRYVAITPVTLFSGVTYRMSSYTSEGYDISNTLASSTTAPEITIVSSYYNSAQGFPTTNYLLGDLYGANFYFYTGPCAFSNENMTACGSITINGNIYSTSQIINDTLYGQAMGGCDSVHVTNFTISTFALKNINQNACDSAMVFGNMYYNSQVIFDTVINGSINGCDSITVINLTIRKEYMLSDSCIVFASILQNATIADTILITNTSCVTLNISSATMTNPDFILVSSPTSIPSGMTDTIVVHFNPSTAGNISGNLVITTNLLNSTICLSGIGLPAPTVLVTPNPMIVNLTCGDSTIQNFTISNGGAAGSVLNVTGGIIGGGGYADSSTVTYTTTGALTTHNFNLTNNGIDTLFMWVNAHGDYDSGLPANEHISDVRVDGVSIGIAATQALTIGNWDSTLFMITDPLLSTVLANGMITVDVQAGTGVNTGFGGALDQHHVRLFTKGEGWLSGTVPTSSLTGGSTSQVPITFYSFGLNQGTYNSTVVIESNDPGSPYLLPVILNVSGSALIGMSDTCIHFGSSIVNETLSDTLEIFNSGCDTILISTLTPSNGAYVVMGISSTIILPGQTSYVAIDFTPITLGSIPANLLIQSNLPDTTICFTGVGSNLVTQYFFSAQDLCSAEVQFADSSRGTPTSWTWDFGDGITSNLQHPIHYFGSIGTYNVQLIACNGLGCDTLVQQVNIAFTLNYNVVTVGIEEVQENLSFSLNGSGVLSVQWNFGDGSNIIPGLTSNHKYTFPGLYIVTASVLNVNGCAFDVRDTLDITNPNGIEDITKYDVSVYPNPARDRVIVVSERELSNARVEIINVLGEYVYQEKNNTLSSNEYVINVEGFDRGTYFIKITTEDGSYLSKKIVLEK